MSTTNVPAYQLLAFAVKNGTQPGGPSFFPAITVDVPATTNALTGIDVEITDIDFSSYIGTYTCTLQIGISGFKTGLPFPYTVPIGHTADAGVVVVPSYGMYYGNVRWFLPQGANFSGQTVDLTAGGSVFFGAFNLPGGTFMGMSYIIVWGVYSTVV